MTPRPLGPADLDAIDLLKPADWPPYRPTFERYFSLDCVFPFGLEDAGRLVSMGSLIAFGKSAWLAQIITHDAVRGRGFGSRMVAFLLEEATRRRMETVSLVATDLGFPLYLKAGFRVEGEYGFWTRATPAPPEPSLSEGVRPLRSDDLAALLELDREASGENREPYFRGRTDGWTGPQNDGFWFPGIGEGLVVARTPEAGIALLHRRLEGATRVAIPAENAVATKVAAARGFEAGARVRRMVWGPSLVRRPEWLWSRIGGNLG